MVPLTRLSFILLVLAAAGCTTIKTEHHITLDHNITIKIEKEVNSFVDDLYGDLEADEPESEKSEQPE